MRELWVELDRTMPKHTKEKFLKLSKQLCDVLLVSQQDLDLARSIGAKRIAAVGCGEIKIAESTDEVARLRSSGEKVGFRVSVKSRFEEDLAAKNAEAGANYIIVSCPNWKVIPLENLIAKVHGGSRLIAEVSSAEEAKVALETLELGADGVLLKTTEASEVEKASRYVKVEEQSLALNTAKVVGIKQLKSGARACVDTVDLMQQGEGIIVGCQSSGLFLVQAEVYENPFVESRPFRVNAGAVSLYTLVPGNKTKYLSELKSGDEILVVDRHGKTRVSHIARVKIEWRPLTLVEAEYKGRILKTILQNAETIRLVTGDGSKSVSELKSGDEVLVRFEEGGRHFGELVKEESLIER